MTDPTGLEDMRRYYECTPEEPRLFKSSGILEFARSKEIILRYLAAPPLVVLDEGAHPTIPDSAMGYDKYTPPWAEALLNPNPEDPRGLYKEPDCSPHPWDIMAVEALYQNAD